MQFFGGSAAADMTPSPAAPPGTATGLAGNNANMLYIFNRNGVCLLYREWHRPLHTLDAQQDQKLMFGLLFSLRSFTAKIDPTSVDKGNLGVPLFPGQGCSFYSFRTNTYKLSFMESPSGIKILHLTIDFIFLLFAKFVMRSTGVKSSSMIQHHPSSPSPLPESPDLDKFARSSVASCSISNEIYLFQFRTIHVLKYHFVT
ncbi:hypothetical protein M5K25_021380 [Dendrobium thyrsiflorum]|uniref:Trafficking protein particle complex subunit n=1 Tax=Dendrobium thyrsiflorum TaxID=117978 RepID=A0ABD0UJ99_DENTH